MSDPHRIRCACGIDVDTLTERHYIDKRETVYCERCTEHMGMNFCERCRIAGDPCEVVMCGDEEHVGEAYCFACAADVGRRFCSGCGRMWPSADIGQSRVGPLCWECLAEMVLGEMRGVA